MSSMCKKIGDNITYRSSIDYIGLDGCGKSMYNNKSNSKQCTGVIVEKNQQVFILEIPEELKNLLPVVGYCDGIMYCNKYLYSSYMKVNSINCN